MSDAKHDVNAKTSIDNTQWIVFVFERVILSRKFPQNATKWQVTNPDNKSNDKTV